MNKIKVLGQIFTQTSVINKMINMFEGSFLYSKILEPSYGSGYFLQSILEKMINEGREKKINDKKIANLINKNLHGYEIDKKFHDLCIKNLKSILEKMKFKEKILFENLKNISAFKNKENNFDLIIGNPPYVRIHNFDEGIKKIKNSLKRINGNTDLFLMFIDFFLNSLSKKSQFIFIVPNSFGKSKSSRQIREWMFDNGSIDYYDFEHEQLFSFVSVYSCIFNFKKNSKSKSMFYYYEKNRKKISKIMENKKYFQPKSKEIINKDFGIKNGIATLLDRAFIFDQKPNFENIFRIYKASKLNQKKYALFPYKIIGNKIERFKDEIEFKKNMPNAFNFLLKHKKDLLKRSLEKNSHWFEYGRSQSLKDIVYSKYVINTLIKPNQKELEIKKIPKNTLVYSGLFTIKEDIIKFNNKKLINYLRFKAKDMRGGYKKISSSLLKYEKQN